MRTEFRTLHIFNWAILRIQNNEIQITPYNNKPEFPVYDVLQDFNLSWDKARNEYHIAGKQHLICNVGYFVPFDKKKNLCLEYGYLNPSIIVKSKKYPWSKPDMIFEEGKYYYTGKSRFIKKIFINPFIYINYEPKEISI